MGTNVDKPNFSLAKGCVCLQDYIMIGVVSLSVCVLICEKFSIFL